MLSQNQTQLHDPANGVTGNCMSAVIANLLHLPVENVPIFYGENWLIQLNKWLRPYGLGYLVVKSNTFNFPDFGIQGCYHDVSGLTKRFHDVYHATCGLDGEIVFDPHPSKAGLTEVLEFGIFIALKPWEAIK